MRRKPVRAGVVEGEGERGQRLAAAGRHGEREQARRLRGTRADMGEDARTLPVDLAFPALRRQVRIQPRRQVGERRPRLARFAADEPLGLEEVGVDQAGEQLSGEKAELEALSAIAQLEMRRCRQACRRRRHLGPAVEGLDRLLQALGERCPLPADPVGQPRMVPGDRVGQEPADAVAVAVDRQVGHPPSNGRR